MSELFRHPALLPALTMMLIGLIGLEAWAVRRKRRILSLLGRPETLLRLMPPEAPGRRNLKWKLRLAVLFFLVLAAAGPQWGVEMTESTALASQVVVAVDTSLSMSTEDIKPNRMSRAKQALSLLLDQIQGSRVGLVAFSGEAYTQCPLTLDREAANLFLEGLDVGMLPEPGTAIGKAIALGAKMLEPYSGQKALILVSDGEDHHSHPLEEAQKAKRQNIQIFTIGIGTPEGEPIPLRDSTGKVTGFKKDSKGGTVLSRLGEKDLIQIAALTGGAYFSGTQLDEAVSEIAARISDLEKSTWRQRSRTRYKNRFQIPLWAAMLLLLAELSLPEVNPEKKNPRIKKEEGQPALTA